MTDGILRQIIHFGSMTQVPYPMPEFVATGILLDDYPDAAFAYSFRKLRTAYAGSAVRIRRSSDNGEADIGFDANGDFDTAAAAAHIGGGSGFLVTWYDQSGNGLNATNAVAATQPGFSATSGPNSKPTGLYGAANNTLTVPSFDLTPYISTQGTIFSVLNQSSTAFQGTLFSWQGGGTRLLIHPTYDNVIYFDFGSAGGAGRISVAQPVGWDDDWHVLECFRTSSDSQNITVDGVSLVTAGRTDDLASGSSALVVGEAASAYFGGGISELVVWGTDLAGNRSAARDSINAYWGAF